MGDFKVGDIVCGIEGNGYVFTNENMKKAKVVKVYEGGEYKNKMDVTILNHSDSSYIGKTYPKVKNSKKRFKLYKEKTKKYELHIVSDGITTNCVYKEDGKLVSRSSAKLHPEDKFDFDIGAKIAIGRCFSEVGNKKSDKIKKQRPTKGKELIGVEVKKGQKFKVINTNCRRSDCVCIDEYIGKAGRFNYDFTFNKYHGYGGSGTYEKDYINAIDKENGGVCWRWDEVELIYD